MFGAEMSLCLLTSLAPLASSVTLRAGAATGVEGKEKKRKGENKKN